MSKSKKEIAFSNRKDTVKAILLKEEMGKVAKTFFIKLIISNAIFFIAGILVGINIW